MMSVDHDDLHAQTQQLRAFVEAQKRAVETADKRYDVSGAVAALKELAAPLARPGDFGPDWKRLYLDTLYRDVAGFVLGFVAVHIEICLSDAERRDAFDVFFDRSAVPPAKSVAALTSALAASSTVATSKARADSDDAAVTVSHCLRLLETSIDSGGLSEIVTNLLEQEGPFSSRGTQRRMFSSQTLVAHLGSLPDLVHNRCERGSPSVFRPRRYFPLLCDAIFSAFLDGNNPPDEAHVRSVVFRMLSEKIIRVGQVDALVQSWLQAIQDTRRSGSRSEIVLHQILLRSLPESCYQQFFQQLAKEPGHDVVSKVAHGAPLVLSEPKYALLSYLPPDMAASQQFLYVLAHKLLLKAPVSDLFVWRVLIDTLIQSEADLPAENRASSPLTAVFDVVLGQWSQGDFPASTDYALNASVSFFLRYAMHKMIETHTNAFASRDWTAKLCKGVQDHMSHSVERVRLLGMRVGETLSLLLSPEKPLSFEIPDVDPLDVYGQADVIIGLLPNEDSPSNRTSVNDSLGGQSGDGIEHAVFKSRRKKKTKRQPAAFTLDPDAMVLSEDDDDDNVSDDQGSVYGDEGDSDSDADSDSDMSLAAYSLEDDERDLQAARPVYLKDLISALLADDEREKTEAALEEAERLLRRRPRDLHDNVREVVTALLRLEDKYNTSNFVTLRSNALAAACALSPVKTLPYFLSQALEREQLLQSRIDILQAMVRASQELSETGEFRVSGPKTLLRSSNGTTATSDLDARTMASLKTRRFGYRRDPLVPAKKNAFSEHALAFFSPLLFGYVEYRRQIEVASSSPGSGLSEVEHVFLAHLLHALASFVEAAGNSPQTVSMAKCLVEFSWVERDNKDAAVRRQVLFCVSRVLLVVPPFLLRQELGESIVEVLMWMQQVARSDPDDGCREASRLLLSSSSIPILSLQ